MSTQTAPVWSSAPEGYELALVEGRVAPRSSKGRVLSSVPAKLKDSEEVKSLRALQEWLDRHERECRARVEEWMLRTLPITTPLVTAVWSDPAWAAPMQDLVVAPADPGGRPAWAQAGLLRAVTVDGIKVVDLDGDTRVVRHPSFVAAHPVLLDELADWQELAVVVRATQGTDQLWRTTFGRPAAVRDDARGVNDFGRREQPPGPEPRALHLRGSQRQDERVPSCARDPLVVSANDQRAPCSPSRATSPAESARSKTTTSSTDPSR